MSRASRATRAGAATSASFSGRVSCLIACSSRSALPLSRQRRTSTTTSGPRRRVYFAPLPASCSAIRAATSRAIPQYSVSSAHRAT
jgi:hypothetical protein